MNSKLHILLLIFLISFPLSFAHDKTQKGSPSTQPNSTNTQDICKGAFSKVFAFGDSFTDTGNALLLGGLKSFVTTLLSNSPFGLPGSRLSNGRLVVDFLCDALDLPLLPPFKNISEDVSQGVNFAIAGATVLSNDFFKAQKLCHSLLFESIPETFQTQIDWFNNFLDEKDCSSKNETECKDKMQNALFWVGELGGDDYSRLFKSPFFIPSVTEMAVSHILKLLKTMLDRGAKYIVVQGLPPQGCCPLSLFLSKLTDRDDMNCSLVANNLIKAHNDLLQKTLEKLRGQYKDCMIVYADYWSAFKTVLGNHTNYQFQEPFKACCGTGGGLFNFDLLNLCGAPGASTCKDPSKFISWDGIHLTEAMNKVIADLFFNKGFCQPSFDQLIKHKKGLL